MIVKFVSITHSECNIWNGTMVATANSWEKCKQVLEGNICREGAHCFGCNGPDFKSGKMMYNINNLHVLCVPLLTLL
jgi:hypothetical protein